jgi:hypothetical protein
VNLLNQTLREMSEKDWELQIVGTDRVPGIARQLGFSLIYHTLRSKGSAPGFPDWVIVRERVVYLELKSEKGALSDKQKRWLLGLLQAGQEAYVARPSDLDDLGLILSHRGHPGGGPARTREAHERMRGRTLAEARS